MDMKGKGSSRDREHGELALVLGAEDAQVELDPEVRLPRLETVKLNPHADRAVDLGHPDRHGDAAGATEVALEAARLDGGQERVLHVDRHLVTVYHGKAAGADVDIGGELRMRVQRRRLRRAS